MHFYEAIEEELSRQIAKYGNKCRTLPELVTILTEEIGEVAKEAHNLHFSGEYDFIEGDADKLRAECIQAAAVLYRIAKKKWRVNLHK